MTTRSPLIAGCLSLLWPGLGQWYNGERPKAIAMICMSLGLVGSVVFFHSTVTTVLLAAIYLLILIPAVRDAVLVARGETRPFAGERRWYVIWMLLVIGPFALPLLWQSSRFSTQAKWIWTCLVIIVGVLTIITAGAVGPMVEDMVKQVPSIP